MQMCHPPPDGHSHGNAAAVVGARRQDNGRLQVFHAIMAVLNGSGLVRHFLVAVCGCRAAFGAVCLRVYLCLSK